MSKRNFESTIPGLNTNTKKRSYPLSKNAVAEDFSPSRRKIKAFLSDKERVLRIKRATDNLNAKIHDREEAEKARDNHFNADVDNVDILQGDVSDEAMEVGAKLRAAVVDAKLAEDEALKELWAAKYDTMTDAELQATVDTIEDAAEKEYAIGLQRERTTSAWKKELETMSAIGDPESEYYDSEFPVKSASQSTKLPDGSLGESDTGYADIDYEFINGNENISEHLVGMEKNYYYLTDQEKMIYNAWYAKDQELGTNEAERYLNLMQNNLDGRYKDEEFPKYDGKVWKEILYAIPSGVNAQTNNVNIGYLMPEDYIPGTSTQMLRDEIYEDLGTAWDSVKFNGQTVPQHLFNWLEDAAYAATGKFPAFMTSLVGPLVSIPVESYFSGLEARGKEYQDRLSRGYPQEYAEKYANLAGLNAALSDVVSDVTRDKIKNFLDKAALEDTTCALGKLLVKEDWFGIADVVQSSIQPYIQKVVTGEEQANEDDLRTTAQSAVVSKAMDKIFNEMGASPDEISLDLRQSLLQPLKDPAAREKVEKIGSFTPMQLEEIIAGLENAGDQDEGIGTYVGDYYYGPSGDVRSKRYMQALADRAFSKPDWFVNDPGAAAIYEKYRHNTP